ncbi:MAG TPA: hypothetical protein PKM97_09675 [Bacteroidia bacterium]|nr:hypothetical protein [Bacteroidia bacterium]
MKFEQRKIKVRYTLIALFLFAFGNNSCKKDSGISTAGEQIEWMHVLDENISGITEDDTFLGQNGKVLTDSEDNIYLYYYSEFPKQAVVMKCDPTGTLVWKKSFPDCIPMDMVRRNDGSIVLAVRDLPGYEQIFVLYVVLPNGTVNLHGVVQTSTGGSDGVLSATMCVLPDDGLIISGVYLQSFLVGFPLSQESFVVKLNPSYGKDWAVLTAFNISQQAKPSYEQNSVVPLPGGKFLAEFSFKGNKIQADSVSYGILRGVINADSVDYESYIIDQTGYEVQSSGTKSGYYNQYGGRLLEDGFGEWIYHYSGAVSLLTGLPLGSDVVNGFIRMNNEGAILDTIPMPLPIGYRVLSCTRGKGNFLLTAYKKGTVDVTSDYSAFQTLFLTGDGGWQTSKSFSFQEFYSDFFPSTAATSDGGFIIMGKIQSFSGPNNKLVLIKWKDN